MVFKWKARQGQARKPHAERRQTALSSVEHRTGEHLAKRTLDGTGTTHALGMGAGKVFFPAPMPRGERGCGQRPRFWGYEIVNMSLPTSIIHGPYLWVTRPQPYGLREAGYPQATCNVGPVDNAG